MLVGAVQVGTYDQFREMFRGMGVTSQFSNVFSASMVSGEMQRQICQMERLTNVHAFMYACHLFLYQYVCMHLSISYICMCPCKSVCMYMCVCFCLCMYLCLYMSIKVCTERYY